MKECKRCGETGVELRASCYNCFAPLELTPEEMAALEQKLEEKRMLALAHAAEEEQHEEERDAFTDDSSRMDIVGDIFDEEEEKPIPWFKKLFAQKEGKDQMEASNMRDKKKEKLAKNKKAELEDDELDPSLVDEDELARRLKESKERDEKERKEKARLENERKKQERKKGKTKRGINETLLQDDVPVELLRSAINAAINTIEASTKTDFDTILNSYITLNKGQQSQIFGDLYNNFNIVANPQGYAQLANTTLSRYSRAVHNNVAEADTFITFLNSFGYGNDYFNAATVSYLSDQRNYVAAMHLIKFLLKTYPYDSVMHAELYSVVDNLQGQITPPIKRSMRELFVEMLAPQYGRRYRYRYFISLAFSQNASDKEKLAMSAESPDRLVMADYKFASNDITQAVQLFYDIAVNSAESLGVRFAAFSGLADCGVKEAVSVMPYLTDEIVRQPETQETVCNMRWYGLEIGKMMVKLASNEAEHPDINPKEAYVAAGLSMAKLIDANPTACLKGENHNGKSLRQSAALVYALADMNREMNEIIDRRIEYTDYPQPGTEAGGTYKETRELIKFISPNYTESDAIRNSVRTALAQYKAGK